MEDTSLSLLRSHSPQFPPRDEPLFLRLRFPFVPEAFFFPPLLRSFGLARTGRTFCLQMPVFFKRIDGFQYAPPPPSSRSFKALLFLKTRLKVGSMFSRPPSSSVSLVLSFLRLHMEPESQFVRIHLSASLATFLACYWPLCQVAAMTKASSPPSRPFS